MGSLKAYATLAGFLAVAASTMTARAADLLPPPPMPEPFEFASSGGWYLRGDVGVSRYEGGKPSSPAVPNAVFYGEDYGSGAFAGAGVGYQFNNWFRADVTGEYRFSTRFKGIDTENFVDQGFPIRGFEKFDGNFSSAVVLVNGYFDLGTWWGVTPFVGGGVGYAHNFMSGFQTSTLNYYTTLPGVVGVSGGSIRDHDKGNFAWALHAGLGYDVNPNVKLEVAYRYLNLGDVRTGLIDCYCGGAPLAGIRVKELDSHDIKIGMRWMLNDVPPAEHPPLMRKY